MLYSLLSTARFTMSPQQNEVKPKRHLLIIAVHFYTARRKKCFSIYSQQEKSLQQIRKYRFTNKSA